MRNFHRPSLPVARRPASTWFLNQFPIVRTVESVSRMSGESPLCPSLPPPKVVSCRQFRLDAVKRAQLTMHDVHSPCSPVHPASQCCRNCIFLEM